MGFERMILFPIAELPSALAYHTIDHFHPGSMELRLKKGSIKATRQKVHDMLGIPMGSMKLEDLEQRPSNDPFIKESTMGTIDNGGRVSTKLLKRITKDVNISYINWCEYILDCLYTSKKNWKDVKTCKNFYYGPLTFLCLLYLDIAIFPDLQVLHHKPTLRSWNTTTMKKRIKMEKETRCLEKLEHHGEFDSEEEQGGMNVYKGLDVYVPPINNKEPKTKEEYKDMFNDVEFNLYESSNDEDSEGDVNGDNEKTTTMMEQQDANKDENTEKEKVETKKEKQDKADKVDNVQEKQDDDKDGIDEDEFWNTQFTDSQCEELENKAKEEIKKKKSAKRKSDMEITPPLFSLSLSPDTNKIEERAAKRAKKSDFIFETKEGNATIRDYMQTLTPTLKIESNTKDMFKWKKEDGKKYDKMKQYRAFSDTMKNEFKKDDEQEKMKDLEMKNMFSMHLKEVQHPRAKDVLNKKPTILRPK
nr:hypothetical protein [Tanacetum cinerariifolium]